MSKRLQTPIRNPLSYAKAMELIKKAKRLVKNTQSMWNRALESEAVAVVAAKALKDQLSTLQTENKQLKESLQDSHTRLKAMPIGGRHSPLVIKVCEDIVGLGMRFQYNSNSYDEYYCPYCEQSVRDSQSWSEIKHSDDCLIKPAQAILDSQPDD